VIEFAPLDQPDDLLFLAEGDYRDFRQFCRDRRLNWRLIADQALHLGANDPEAFDRAVEHLTDNGETTP